MTDYATFQQTAGRAASEKIDVRAERLPIWREMFAGLDWLALRVSAVYRGVGVPRGTGTPVVVVPGLFAADGYLAELHDWLRRIGYAPSYSRIGRNVECPRVMVERLLTTVQRVHGLSGQRVSVVGHSLGGLIARGAAIQRPDLIAEVITVGSPVNGVRAHPAILRAAERVGGSCKETCLAWLQAPLPVGVSEASVYSRFDGVVGWPSCIPVSGAPAVEVHGTHTGLVFNPQSFAAIAGLLSDAVARRRDPVMRGRLRLIVSNSAGRTITRSSRLTTAVASRR